MRRSALRRARMLLVADCVATGAAVAVAALAAPGRRRARAGLAASAAVAAASLAPGLAGVLPRRAAMSMRRALVALGGVVGLAGGAVVMARFRSRAGIGVALGGVAFSLGYLGILRRRPH